MEKMTMKISAISNGKVVREQVPVGLIGIRAGTLDDEPYAIVMMDPENEICRELFGIDDSNPYAEVRLRDLRPAPGEFNRIFGK